MTVATDALDPEDPDEGSEWKLDMRMLVHRPYGSSWIGGCGGRGGGFPLARGLMITSSSRSSPEWTPLEDSDGARSGGDVVMVLSVVEVVSLRGVSASLGTPESARRRQRGVELEAIWVWGTYKEKVKERGISESRGLGKSRGQQGIFIFLVGLGLQVKMKLNQFGAPMSYWSVVHPSTGALIRTSAQIPRTNPTPLWLSVALALIYAVS